MPRVWERQTDGRTDGRSDCTPRPAFAFGDAGKNRSLTFVRLTIYVFTSIYKTSSKSCDKDCSSEVNSINTRGPWATPLT